MIEEAALIDVFPESMRRKLQKANWVHLDAYIFSPFYYNIWTHLNLCTDIILHLY